MEQHRAKFDPKLRAYRILQHKVEDVFQESIKIWKIVCGLLSDKDEGKGANTSKVVEPEIKQNKMETGTPKEVEDQDKSEVHIVDITEESPIKNSVLIEADLKTEEENDISLPSSNTVLL